jgi:glucose/arabinose dehydrogenase
MNAQKCSNLALHLTCTFLAALFGLPSMLNAQAPSLVDPNLRVRTVVENLDQPTTMAFLGPNDFFVLEKATGQVKRVVDGVVQSTVLDLAVNSGSERGLLGIALHPDFPATAHVYLYWTESTTGADTDVLANTPLLGNRVDRFVWKRLHADAGYQPHPPARLAKRCHQRGRARQPRRRGDQVWAGRQAVHLHR